MFPAISLVLLAYTNRFLGLSGIIRNLYSQYQDDPDPTILLQINNLRARVGLIRNMQLCGVISMILCICSILILFGGQTTAGNVLFAASLLMLLVSMLISAWELVLSTHSLKFLLAGMEDDLADISRLSTKNARKTSADRHSDPELPPL